MTTRKIVDPRERAARALCRRDGHPENIKFEGKLGIRSGWLLDGS